MRTFLCILFVALFLNTGCQNPKPVLSKGIIINQTSHELRNVTAIHYPTRQQVSTTLILPGKSFALGFSPRTLLSDTVEISWMEKKIEHHAKINLLEIEQARAQNCTSLIYEITPGGNATARFAE